MGFGQFIDHLKDLWETWDLRWFILISLTLQALLILFSPLRKRTSNSFVTGPLWLAYLLADASANFAVGLISKSQRDNSQRTADNANANLLALWGPFLLIHLGGPDTITAFALEDNELWLRHLLQLIFQSATAAYIFFLTIPNKNDLWPPTVLLFVAGLIKFSERTRALYLASTRRFRESLLTKPDPGPNYAKLMDEYYSKKEAKLPTRIEMIPEPHRIPKPVTDVDRKPLKDLEVVQQAHRLFTTFKGLIAELIFSFKERNQTREYFLNRTPKDAFKIVEVELNFFYEILYTKVVVIQSIGGLILRFLSIGSVVGALVYFYMMQTKDLKPVDVRITYALLWGGIALDVIAFYMVSVSDWTAVALTKSENQSSCYTGFLNILGKILLVDRDRWTEGLKTVPLRMRLVPPILRRRWSGKISQYNLVNYCLNPRWKPVEKLYKLVGLTNILDANKYVHKEAFTPDLRDYIFEELRTKSLMADDLETAKEICSAKGEWILGFIGCTSLIHHSAQADFDESLLLWHIATELCYNDPKDKDNENNEFRTYSKLLSDYLLYLLIMQPTMMSAVVGIGQIRFRDTCAEAKKFFIGRKLGEGKEGKKWYRRILDFCKCCCCGNLEGGKDEKRKLAVNGVLPRVADEGTKEQRCCGNIFCCFKKWCCKGKEVDPEQVLACQTILAVNTEVKPVTVKGDRSKSVLFDGCILAKELMEFKEKEKGKDESKTKDKWEIMSKVWVELLCYAACHCRANTHAAQLSKGGQLVTLVWLLMAHLGLGDQFQINEGHARAKLIVGK